MQDTNIRRAGRELTPQQQAVIDSNERYILVASCPGSGKSFTLKHMNDAGKSTDMKLSFARADAEALRSGDRNGDRSVSTIDSLGWQTLIKYGTAPSVYDEESFLTEAELKRFAGVFYDGGWDELTEAIKPLNGGTRRNIARKLVSLYGDYESSGVKSTSKRRALQAANQFIDYLQAYIRNYPRIDAALKFADGPAWDWMVKLNYGSEERLFKTVKADKNEILRAYIFHITGQPRRKKNNTYLSLGAKSKPRLQRLAGQLDSFIDSRLPIMAILNNLTDEGWAKLLTTYWHTAASFTADTGWNPASPADRAAFEEDCIRCLRGEQPDNPLMKGVYTTLNRKEWHIDPPPPHSYGQSYLLGEISVEFLRLIRENPDILTPLLRGVDRILVDEGQDLSEVQADIINEFANQTDVRICIFYDGDQSMYAFRNAAGDLANRKGFLSNDKGTRVLMHLSDNFRSSNEIISLANAIRSHITDSSGETIHAARNSSQPKPALKAYASDRDEAAGIIQWIQDLSAINTPLNAVPLRSIAVICRTGYVRDFIAAAINKYGADHGTELFTDEQWNQSAKKYEPVGIPLRVRTENGLGVNVITAHRSKGRQYDAVWVAGVEKDLWPLRHDKGQQRLTPRERQEELRSFYVAVTRAKNRLVISYAGTRNPMLVRGKADRPETHEPSSFLPTSKVNKKFNIFPMDLVNFSRVTESIATEQVEDLDAGIRKILEKFTNAKWSNRKIQYSFEEKVQELNKAIAELRAEPNPDPDRIAELEEQSEAFVKRTERIRNCAQSVRVGVFNDETMDGAVEQRESITNYNRCRDRWCELDQNMYSADNASRLNNAMMLIDAASKGWDYARLNFKGLKDDYRLAGIPSDMRSHTQQLAKTSQRPNPSLKGLNHHKTWVFLTVTMPYNVPLSQMLVENPTKSGKTAYRPIQQLIHAMTLALHPSRGTDWSKSSVNGMWLTTEITVKSPIRQRADGKWEPDPVAGETQEPMCHVHCHMLLDLDNAYWEGKYSKTGSDGTIEYDLGNYMTQGTAGDDMAWHLKRSMESAGIHFAPGQLPIVRMQAVQSLYEDIEGSDDNGESGRQIYQEVTKYATKASYIFPTAENENPVWDSRDAVKPYVARNWRKQVIYTLAEAEKGVRMQRVYGTIKDALRLVDARQQELADPQEAESFKEFVCDEDTLRYSLVEEGAAAASRIESSSIAQPTEDVIPFSEDDLRAMDNSADSEDDDGDDGEELYGSVPDYPVEPSGTDIQPETPQAASTDVDGEDWGDDDWDADAAIIRRVLGE